MEQQTKPEIRAPVPPFVSTSDISDLDVGRDFWEYVGVLWKRRYFIAGVTALMAVLSIVISLLLPKEFKAETRLVLPGGSGLGMLSGLSSDLSSAANALLGRGGGDYLRFLAILDSRTVRDSVIHKFDLIHLYEVDDSKYPMRSARKALDGNVEFVIDDEYEFLAVEVFDEDPGRAADMANYFVEQLNKHNALLSVTSASKFRRYVQSRYEEALAYHDSLLSVNRSFQEEYGVFDLPTQTEGFFTYLGNLRGEALKAEIEYEALSARFGQDNARVQGYAELVAAARRKYNQALAGSEEILPVPKGEIPALVMQYANLQRELTIQQSILEIAAPVYEQARFDEEREIETVQVIDPASPPEYKARPKRMVIVVAATLSAFLACCCYVLLLSWWRSNRVDVLRRMGVS